jgi:two-component system, response regulator YesN
MTMKKILIVDDEFLVRLGLKTTIDWAKYGYVIAGEANNGKEALAINQKIGADLILTDIKMPIMDGLELIKEVKRTNKKVQTIFLSHYDEFSYAQEAMELGAFRYILKSELTKTNLESIIQDLFYSQGSEYLQAPTEMLEEKQEAYIRNQLWPSLSESAPLLPAGTPLPPDELFGSATYYLVVGSCKTLSLSKDARKMFPKTVKLLLAEANPGSVSFGDYGGGQFQFISLVPKTGEDPSAERLIESCSLIVRNIRQYYTVLAVMGISSAGSPEDFSRLVAEAYEAMKMCFFSEKNTITEYSRPTTEQQAFPPHINYSKLQNLIDADQKEEMLAYIQSIFRILRDLKNTQYVHDAFIELLFIGKSVCEKYHIEEQASLSSGKFNYEIFTNFEFIADIELYIYELFLELLIGKKNGKTTYSFIVKKCIAFIQSNYTQNITLSEAARAIEVSHSYLSFLFKQEMGINFNAYLSRYRVEQAKQLLEANNMKIYEVADAVGFSDPYYFSRVFKEITGMSCKKYRDQG